MATIERIIPPHIAEDGSVHYSSVMSPPDDSIAVCYMVPDRIIPVIFVPGVMGTNLKSSKTGKPVWLVDGMISVTKDWGGRDAAKRKLVLDPANTEVYGGGTIATGTAQSEAELRRRGWGEVANWLQSNEQSAERLQKRIQHFMGYHRGRGFKCDYVIIVTHSMGGLVSRYYSEVKGGAKHVLGVVHAVMPATGSATAYKRVKAGTEMPAGFVLGADAAEMTAVFAQSPGPLQLLPSPEYGRGWLRIRDGEQLISLPKEDPYSEIYTQRHKWWGLVDDQLLNPLDPGKKTIEQDWSKFTALILNTVQTFHTSISGRYHANTYAFYGDDTNHKTWGDVVWKRKLPPAGLWNVKIAPLDDLLNRQASSSGTGSQTIPTQYGEWQSLEKLVLQEAHENGDGTVPVRSGAAPGRRVKMCVPYRGIDHEGAFKEKPQQLFALWAITKIAYSVRETGMAYKK